MLSFSKRDEVYFNDELQCDVTKELYSINFRGTEIPLDIINGDVLFNRKDSYLFGIRRTLHEDFVSFIYGEKKDTIKLIRLNDLIKDADTKNKSNRGMVYLISDGKYTKIGMTSIGASVRLKSLQIGNARELKIIGEYFTKNRNVEESRLHKKYFNKRMQGEWFDLSDIDILDIINTGISEYKEEELIKLDEMELSSLASFCRKIKIEFALYAKYSADDMIIEILPTNNDHINYLIDQEDNPMQALLYAYDNKLIDFEEIREQISEILELINTSNKSFNEAKSMVDNITLIDLV